MSPLETAGMSMVVRPPDSRPPRGSRTGDDTALDGLGPSSGFLPQDGAPVPAPAPTPQRALALDALQVLRRMRGSIPTDTVWDDIAFGRQIDAIRRQLEPIRSRRALAASFEREAFHVRRAAIDETAVLGPVRIAYAVRWLELGDGDPRPAWAAMSTARGRAAGRRAPRRRRTRGWSAPRR